MIIDFYDIFVLSLAFIMIIVSFPSFVEITKDIHKAMEKARNKGGK